MRFLIFSVLLFLLPFSLSAEEIYEGAGTAGMVFLKIGVGARGSGLAGAYSAVADNSMAIFWNPAGLVNVEGTDISFAHSEYVENTRYEIVSFALETEIGSFGLGAGALYSDDLELREKPGEPEGYFRYSDYLLSLSYARRMSPESDIGVTVKALQERIYIYTASGFAFDFGATFRPEGLKNVVFSGAIQNLGPKLKYREETFRLPLTVKVGAAYMVPTSLVDGNWLLSVEGSKPIDAGYIYSGGIEYTHKSGLGMRAGYKHGHDMESYSAGAGFAIGNMRLDYSYVPWRYDFGPQHWISVGVNL
ncbi:MAG: PorV/PorQ family protein [bacterium]